MLQSIRNTFSSIGFKLFLWFWLFAISTVLFTRLLSAQLSQDSVILPAHLEDKTKLRHIAKRLEKGTNKGIRNGRKAPAQSPEDVNLQPRFLHGASLIIKDEESGEVFAADNRSSRLLSAYLERNTISSISSIQFSNVRLTGPQKIVLADKSYQLFYVKPGKSRHFNSFVMHMPIWLRIAIPIVVSLVLSWLLAKTLTKPILSIRQAAIKIGDGRLETRLTGAARRNDEVGDLARHFNAMADKLSQNLTANQRLLADVSHELRSPMTRLQMAIGLAQQTFKSHEEQAKHLARCELEVSRLDKMISDVLSLSRLENTFQRMQLETVKLDSFVKNIIQDCQYLANDKQITITYNQFDTINLKADKNLLLSAISNVIINAIKYTPEKSEISVNMSLLQDQVCLIISDQGPGVPEENLGQLFHAFYRVEEARDRNSGGTGLGLAIAQHAIHAHNGEISAKNNADKGLTITMHLPIA